MFSWTTNSEVSETDIEREHQANFQTKPSYN